MASMALAFDILARDKGASRTFDKVGDSADRAGKKGRGFGTAIKAGLGIASGALAALGLGQAIGAISGQLSDAIGEAREAQKVGATTAAIIKSTGGAAKVSAKQVADLAESISNKVGVDDEAIQTGANLLLTFKNVRNEAGKGSKVFDRATAAAVDLSKAGFGSIDSASKMLGKALNDPLKGLTALGRAGVTFTDQQKQQIKTLTESGDVLAAQKIILAEVESQVGGVAAATATTADKVKVSWANVKEEIGAKLLPILDRLGQWFLDKGLPAIERFGGWLTDKLWPALQEGWKTVLPGVTKALDILTGGTGDGEMSWKKLGDVITEKVIPFLADLFNVYLPAAAAQIRVVIEAVKLAWGAFETWRDRVMAVRDFLLGAFATIADGFATVLRALGKIPGFGWADEAADSMSSAAQQARNLAAGINKITSKSVTVSVHYKSSYSGRFDPAPTGYTPGRSKGGPVTRGVAYAVGENPDGSWNKTTELFVPNQSGRILNQQQLAAKATASTAGATAEGGSPIDYYRLEDAVTRGAQRATLAVGVRELAPAVNRHNTTKAIL